MQSPHSPLPSPRELPAVADELDRELTDAEIGIYLSTSGVAEVAEELAARADAAGLVSRSRRARLLASDALSRRSELEQALPIQLRILGDAEHDGDRMTCARAQALLASTYERLADTPKSQAAAEASVQLLAPQDPGTWHAEHMMLLALYTSTRRQAAVDFTTFEEAVRRARELAEPVLLLAILNNYAWVLLEASDARGIAIVDEMTALIETDLRGKAPAAWLDTIAHGMLAAERPDEAAAAVAAAISTAPEDRVEHGAVANCLLTAAAVERARGDLGAAEAHLREARRHAEADGAPEPAALALRQLADLAALQERYREAYELLQRYLSEWSRFQTERTERHAVTVQAIYGAETERRRREAVERLADTDPLTGLWNRRFLNRRLSQLAGRPLTLALIDLDHFKQVNDRFSHDAGDLVLRRVSELLRLHAEPAGEEVFACRIGGEEFVLVAPNSDGSEAVRRCERIRVHIQAADWSGIAPGLAITASIGVAIDPAGTASPSELLSRADVRLYEAKRQGRNRVISDPHRSSSAAAACSRSSAARNAR